MIEEKLDNFMETTKNDMTTRKQTSAQLHLEAEIEETSEADFEETEAAGSEEVISTETDPEEISEETLIEKTEENAILIEKIEENFEGVSEGEIEVDSGEEAEGASEMTIGENLAEETTDLNESLKNDQKTVTTGECRQSHPI